MPVVFVVAVVVVCSDGDSVPPIVSPNSLPKWEAMGYAPDQVSPFFRFCCWFLFDVTCTVVVAFSL